MENRFGVKDFVLFALVVLLIVIVVLAMFQFDRQYRKLDELTTQQARQTDDLAGIRRQVQAMARDARNGTGPAGLVPPAVGANRFNKNSGVGATTTPSVVFVPTSTPPAPVAGAVARVEQGSDPFSQIKAAEAMPGYAQGDTLIVPAPRSDKLTPLTSGDAFAATVQGHVVESLLTRDPLTLGWQPLLAQPGWVVEDNTAAYAKYITAHPPAADAKVADPAAPIPVRITFKLRPSAVFSDGSPVTADDVVWTFDWIMNPAVEAPRQRAFYGKIRRVYKNDDGSVTFDFNEPYFDAQGLAGGMSVLPKAFYSQFSPTDFNASVGLVMGSGPYRMTDAKGWTPGKPVELVRNEHYWGEPAALAKIIYRVIVEDQVKLTAFKNGELDEFPANPVQYKNLLGNAAVTGQNQHFEYSTANAGYRFIAWNQERDKKPTYFADKRVRQAMTMLVDRKRICDDILLGYSTPATGPFNRLGKQCDPGIEPWPAGIDNARAVLKQAGFTDDGQGNLKGPDGQPFTFRLTYPSGSPLSDRVVLFMKDSFAKAGVTLEPDRLDWSIFSERLKNHAFDAIMLGWTAGIEDDIYQMFDSHEISNGGEDWMSYRNAELDSLIETARTTVDESKRIPMWRRCHAILHEDQPYTFLYTSKSLLFLDNRLKNGKTNQLGMNDLVEWFVPTAEQKYKE